MFLFLLLAGIPLTLFSQYKENTFLATELAELEAHLKYRDSINQSVSKVSVAWHIDHSLKVIDAVMNSLEKSDPKAFKSNINFLRGLVLTTNNMPRGAGKASKSVTPPDIIHTKDILTQLTAVKERLLSIDGLPRRAHFNHPVFGIMKRKKSKRFIMVHTVHHLKIIRDILAN